MTFSQQPRYSEVKIFLDGREVRQLAATGIAMDEGVLKKDALYQTILSTNELLKVQKAGFRCEIITEDYQKMIRERNSADHGLIDEINRNKHAMFDVSTNYTVPDGFHLGSMGGFYTLDEVNQELDSLSIKYPDLVTTKRIAGGETTVNGRNVYYVKISDNPNLSENEPKIFYNALIHAREPANMQELFFFINWLLENYNTNDEAKYIVDNSEIYFLPVVNPDGYEYNHQQSPTGGGMWRKNREVNSDGSYGVDLNRNFGYEWGYDNYGSSPIPSDESYRGPSAFSEPESRIIRDFTNNIKFKLSLNGHTYGDLLLYPWCYTTLDTPDSSTFDNFAEIMTDDNGYTYGTPGEVLYNTNGDAMDWMYGDVSSRPKVIAFAPEVGNNDDDFWPPVSRIIPICQETMKMNLLAAHLVLAYAEAKDKNPAIIPQKDGYLKYNIERYGMANDGVYTVSVIPLDSVIISTGNPKIYQNLTQFQSKTDSISYVLDPSIQPGTRFSYILNVFDGHCNHPDTIVKYFGQPMVIFSDDCSSMANWNSTKWNTNTRYYVSAPSSLTDSPNGYYSGHENNSITSNFSLDMGASPVAVINYECRWSTEKDYDYVQFRYSKEGVYWNPLKGLFTHPGSIYEDPGKPVYDGSHKKWENEEVLLEDADSLNIQFRFTLRSDAYTNDDGFYFDDFKVTVI
ncbi:MAG: M14 family zinc carboxypeptidase, partial [Bacteroidota bacterium]|nr:M14 family zinc carboxypeptidase [Bacteroidota bacterium]